MALYRSSPRSLSGDYITVYALDRRTNLGPRATKAEVLEAIRDHVLGQAQIMGRYQRAAGAKPRKKGA